MEHRGIYKSYEKNWEDKEMAVHASSPLPFSLSTFFDSRLDHFIKPYPNNHQSTIPGSLSVRYHRRRSFTVASQLQTLKLDKSALNVAEAVSEAELWAASLLRVRSFYDFQPSFGIQDHKRYLAEREFEALKERVAGKRLGFRRVSCINATLPLSQVSSISDDLCTACKFSKNGEDRVVVGTLDLNQCIRLPDEITGMKPKVLFDLALTLEKFQ